MYIIIIIYNNYNDSSIYNRLIYITTIKEDNIMRSENEKKSIVKSIKLSPLQEQQIKKLADEKGMNFSEYMVHCALHNSNGITPQMAVKMQEMTVMIIYIKRNSDRKLRILMDCLNLFHRMRSIIILRRK